MKFSRLEVAAGLLALSACGGNPQATQAPTITPISRQVPTVSPEMHSDISWQKNYLDAKLLEAQLPLPDLFSNMYLSEQPDFDRISLLSEIYMITKRDRSIAIVNMAGLDYDNNQTSEWGMYGAGGFSDRISGIWMQYLPVDDWSISRWTPSQSTSNFRVDGFWLDFNKNGKLYLKSYDQYNNELQSFTLRYSYKDAEG